MRFNKGCWLVWFKILMKHAVISKFTFIPLVPNCFISEIPCILFTRAVFSFYSSNIYLPLCVAPSNSQVKIVYIFWLCLVLVYFSPSSQLSDSSLVVQQHECRPWGCVRSREESQAQTDQSCDVLMWRLCQLWPPTMSFIYEQLHSLEANKWTN